MADKIIKIIQASTPNITINHNRDGKDGKTVKTLNLRISLLHS